MNFIETGYHEVNANRYPDLGLYRVLRCPVESLDPEILFDPFEEELDMPTVPRTRDRFERWSLRTVQNDW